MFGKWLFWWWSQNWIKNLSLLMRSPWMNVLGYVHNVLGHSVLENNEHTEILGFAYTLWSTDFILDLFYWLYTSLVHTMGSLLISFKRAPCKHVLKLSLSKETGLLLQVFNCKETLRLNHLFGRERSCRLLIRELARERDLITECIQWLQSKPFYSSS